MKWRFWQRIVPPVSNECTHLWSNWSEPGECRVKLWTPTWNGTASESEREGWSQDRNCLKCNLYERRVA